MAARSQTAQIGDQGRAAASFVIWREAAGPSRGDDGTVNPMAEFDFASPSSRQLTVRRLSGRTRSRSYLAQSNSVSGGGMACLLACNLSTELVRSRSRIRFRVLKTTINFTI